MFDFDIEEELKKLPKKPGIYIMKDLHDTVLYVGKAVSLKDRVRQYFRKNNKTTRIEKMVSRIHHFEYIVTDNEAEALILECNLIKEHRPKYNVLLKDDKMYPYIKVDVTSDFPNVVLVRKVHEDGAKYFGPYANAGAAKEMLGFIREKFMIRQCRKFKSNTRPCLNYHIKRCMGPCVGKISKEEYAKLIDQILDLLAGKTERLLKQINVQIQEACEKLDYEQAAYLRDKKIAIENISEKQKMSNISENDIDVIGYINNGIKGCLEIFFVRNSRMIGREHYFFDNISEIEDKEVISGFLKQFYLGKKQLPNKIMIQQEIEDFEAIQIWLSKEASRKVEIKIPQKGEKLKFVEMAKNNARITLDNKSEDKFELLTELQEVLGLEKLPRKIECFDISNTAGQDIVGGMCVMQDGIIDKRQTKRFKIKEVAHQDDPRCMEEVIKRRIAHSVEEPEGRFGKLPDVIFVDGGITQIKAAKRALVSLAVVLPVYGMVKDYRHRTKALIDEEKNEFPISDSLKNMITNMQDTVHDIAITYHKKLRDAKITKSELDEVKGIGDKKKQELLKRFGDIEHIKEASLDEIVKTKGMNEGLAKRVKDTLIHHEREE